MELKAYINVLLRKWWIVLPVFLITLTVVMLLTYTQTPIYSATVTYVVLPSASFGDQKSFANGLSMLGQRDEIATTFAEIASSRNIRQLARGAISLEADRGYTVSGKLRAGTNIIELTAQGPDPVITRDLINAVGVVTESYVKGSYEVFILRLLDEATTPNSPISPNKTLNFSLAVILGLILGGGLAFLAIYFETPVNASGGINIIDNETGVYNKDYFMRRLSNEMVRAKRNRYPLSVALMRVVDTLGLKGPNSSNMRTVVLQQVSALTDQYLREEDIIAYLGDDTFAFLLPDVTGENAKAIMEYIQTRIGLLPFQANNNSTKLNLKSVVGVAAYNHNGTSREEFVAQADRALRLAEVNDKSFLINDSDNQHA